MGILARQALFNTVLTYVGIGLGFINVVLLYPKVLDSDQFGLTRLMVSLVTVSAQFAQLGVENTVIRFFPYYHDPLRKHRGLLAAILLFATVVGSLTTLVLGLMHGWLSDVFSDRNGLYGHYGLLILPLVFGEIYFILLRSYSRSLRRTVQPTFIREFLLRLMQTALILVQAWHPMPFGIFLLIYTALFLICTMALVVDLWRAGHFRPGWSYLWMPGRMRRSMFTYSGFTFSASLAGIVLGNMDQLMIGALLGDGLRNVAYYAVAFYFGSVIAAPGRALSQAAMPFVSEAWKRRDITTLRKLYRRSSLVQTMVSGLLFLLMWMSLDDLFTLLPAEYAGGASVAWVIGLAYLMNSTVGLSVGIISMSRSYRLDAYSSFSMLAVNLIANFFMIRAFGIIGAAWATFISLLLVNLFRTVYLWKRYQLWPYGWETLKVLMLLALLAIVFTYIPFTGAPLWDLIIRSALITAVFIPVVYTLGVYRELIPMLRNMFPGGGRLGGGGE
jgi:O-antigen/teichoic acid export membrane protein